MDPLESFIEFAQWTGSVEEARERINAAGGDVELALEQLYSGFFEHEDTEIPKPKPSVAEPPLQSLHEELNSEYTRDLVRNPAPRIPGSGHTLLVLNPLLGNLFSKLCDLLCLVGLGKYLFTSPKGLVSQSEESRARYHKNTVRPLLEKTRYANTPERRYNEALDNAKTKLNYLLVVITNELYSERSEKLVQWLNSNCVIDEKQTELWFGSILTVEGFAAAKTLNVGETPAIAIIAASPKTAQSTLIVMERLFSMSWASIESNHKRLGDMMKAAIDSHEGKMLALRLQQQRFDSDRHIREEQDSAYQRSLEADQQRVAKIENDKKKKKTDAELHKLWQQHVLRRSKAVQPAQILTDSAKIGVRLPNGNRIVLNIPRGATLEDLYCIVYSKLNEGINEEAVTETLHGELDNYQPHYGFGLVSPILRKTLDYDSTPVNDVEALWPSGVVMVDLIE